MTYGTLESFQKEMGELCEKYGYPYYFAALGEPADAKMRGTNYYFIGNHMSEGLIETLEQETQEMRDELGL